MTGAEQSALHSVRAIEAAERGNVVELTPNIIGWLQIPLSPDRKAAIDRFEASTGYPITNVILDLLDDQVFALRGGKSCVQGTRNYPQNRPESADKFQHPRTELSKGPSDRSQGSSGRITPRHSSPPSCGATCEQPDDGLPAKSTRPPTSGPSCSPSPQTRIDPCGND